MANLPAPSNDEARTKLVEIAARLADREAGADIDSWLRAFRKNYRHMAVTFGQTFRYADLSSAEMATDAALDPQATGKAA